MLALALCSYILQVLYLGSIVSKCELVLIALVTIVSVNVMFFYRFQNVGKEECCWKGTGGKTSR